MLRRSLLWLSEHPGAFQFVRRNGIARRFASRFVAGETLDEALAVACRLNEDGLGVSLDLLGESVTDAAEAAAARDEVLKILDRIPETGGDTNVSIKLTQLGLDIDEDLCREHATTVLDRARELDIFVRLDMESSAYTDRTLRLFLDHLEPVYGTGVGVVIQSYLRRSADDVEVLASRHARVRLCKGAYAEPPEVAFQERHEVSASYERLMHRLLEDGTYPGLATHDEDLIDRAIAWVEQHDIASERFEFQMLYGVRRDLQRRLRGHGFNVRIYVPFGTQWYPYLMRRLAERPANLMFMTMSVLKELAAPNR